MVGKIVLIVKICFYIFLFSVLFLSETEKADAQSCPSAVSYDVYKCDEYDSITGCKTSPIREGNLKSISCEYDSINNNCISVVGVCSSNDTCEKTQKPFGVGYFCKCSNSPIDCNNPPTGTPPPGGGGDTETCIAGLTAPNIDNITRPTFTKGKIDWTRGSTQNKQKLYVGGNKCVIPPIGQNADPSCVVEETFSALLNKVSYTTGDAVLTANKLYFWRIYNWKQDVCYKSDTAESLSSCSMSPSSLPDMNVGDSSNLTVSLSGGNAVVNAAYSNASFSSGNSAIASISPGTDSTNSYVTTVSAVAPGDTTVTVVMNPAVSGVFSCTSQIAVHVNGILSGSAWWQVKDGDVASNGDLTSNVPVGEYFDDLWAARLQKSMRPRKSFHSTFNLQL
jgi:hypothetical protein